MNTLFFFFFFCMQHMSTDTYTIDIKLDSWNKLQKPCGQSTINIFLSENVDTGMFREKWVHSKTFLDDWLHFSSHKKKDLLLVFGWVSIHVNYKGSDIVGRRGTYQFSGHPGRGHIGLGPWWRGGNNIERERAYYHALIDWAGGRSDGKIFP